MRKKILFITGSLNQASQMRQIAQFLPEYDCWFSQIFSDTKVARFLINKTSILNGTALTGQFKENTERYLQNHDLQVDYKASKNNYDLVVFCSDLIVPKRLRKTKTIWVQEGMIDRVTFMSHLIKAIGLPPFLTANTSLNGSTNKCDIYCAASYGYKEALTNMGTSSNRIIVTGIPNYDDLYQFANNDFPHKGYVMVATTDMRETLRFENRVGFIKKAVKLANGRQLLFKLHPNENFERAEAEIIKHTPPDTLIYTSGNTNEMIANCAELITQYSTVVYTGIALGKKVHSWFDVDELERLMPIQNEGTSAQNIAKICAAYIEYKGDRNKFLKDFSFKPVGNAQTEGELVLS
ncbi:hypothetical protein [Mucilaginibacter sp.]